MSFYLPLFELLSLFSIRLAKNGATLDARIYQRSNKSYGTILL